MRVGCQLNLLAVTEASALPAAPPCWPSLLPLPAALVLCRQFSGDPVTSQPDVTELALVDGDEFLVVASDGLWDVLDSQEVVKLARRELQRGTGPQVRRR